MVFQKTAKKENNPDGNLYTVQMRYGGRNYYVCQMIDGDTPEAAAVNELGLTLRARLVRSKGKYAMLEGTIFNPSRLLDAACEVTDYSKDYFVSGDSQKGYTLLSITADGCVNKYMIFDTVLLRALTSKLKNRIPETNA